MAKDAGREVSIHLTLGDSDFSKQFSSIIGGLTDQLNKAGKNFATQMAQAEKSIRQSTEALSDTVANSPGRQARSKGSSSAGVEGGVENAEDSMARANKLMQEMEKRSLNASDGAMRMGTEYEEVQKVVSQLVTATEKLKKGSRISPDLKAQNRLRKQAGKTINQLIKKVKQLARTEQISREQADRMLKDLRDGAARYSDERIRAEKAISSVQRKSMSEFRRQMRSRIALVDSLPEKHEQVRKQLESERKTLVQKVKANEDNLEAIERLAEVKKTIGKLDKQEKGRRQAQAAIRDEQEKQRAAGSELAFGKDLEAEKKRVKQQLQEMRKMIAQQDPFEALRGGIFGDELRKEEARLEEIFAMMDKEGEESAEGLKRAQEQRVDSLDEEIKRLIQRDEMGDASAEDEMRLNSLVEERARVLRNIENTEEQITREKKNQTIASRKQKSGVQGAGRKASRRRRRRNGTLAGDNAALQASRLVQDAPFGLLGMVNNIDMAVESMVKLRKQAGSTGAALKKMAFGSTASIMLWTNALFAAVLILEDHISLADEFGGAWDDTKARIFGAGDAIEELGDKIDEMAQKELEILDSTTTEDAAGALQKVTEQLAELRRERSEIISGPETLSGPDPLFGLGKEFGPGALLSRFTNSEEISEVSDQIETLENFKEKLESFAAKGLGMQEAFENSAEIGPLVVKEHLKTLKAIRGHQEEMAAIALKGRDGEEALPFEREKIKARYKNLIRELQAELKQENLEFKIADAAGNDAAALAADQRSVQLQRQIEAQRAARERELASVGEDGSGGEDPADGLRKLIDLRHEVQRREIELSEEGLEEKTQIIEHELKVQKVALDRRLEDFEGTATQEAEFAEKIAERKAQAEKQAERDKTEAVREHARKRRQIRKKNAEVELRLQKRRLSLQDDTDSTEIERSRLKMRQNVLKMNEEIAKAEEEGHTERVKDLRKIRNLETDLHNQRVAEIRAETQERQRQMSKEIDAMIEGADRYSQRIATFQTGMFRGAVQGEVERIQMQRDEAIASARQEFNARLQEIDENETQAEDTLANDRKFYQQRLSLYEWFRKEKDAIREDFDDQERQAIRENQRQFAQMVGGQLSSRLSDISSGLNDLQSVFVENRKQQLIEQGVAEEEAADRAEEAGRRRFAIKKKVAVAEATVNTFNAAMNAYEQASQFGGLAGGIAAFTTALTFGFAQVAKIRAMSIGGGRGKSGGGVDVSGLGSSTDSAGSQVTDPDSPFAPNGAGLSTGGKRRAARQGNAEEQIKGLRDDMERHTAAIENMEPEAKVSDETVIDVGDQYNEHKDEDTF